MSVIATGSKNGLLNRIQWEAYGGIRLDLLGYVSFPTGHHGTPHSHPFWELIFIGSGAGCLHHGEGVSPCKADEILLVKPGEMHQFRACESPSFDQLYLGFTFDFAMPESLAQSAPHILGDGPFAGLIRSELRENLNRLKEKNGGQPTETIRARLLSVVSRVIGFLAAPDGGSSETGSGQTESLIRTAKELMHATLKGKMGVPELARHFCLSPQYFGEVFKRETGVSVKEYQRHCRMDRAMELLRESRMSVTEIAEEVGLDDLAYFSRLFKKQYNMSPRQVRAPRLAG